MIDEKDLEKLKHLTNDDLLFITDPDLLRGVDYRADEDANVAEGLSIMIMESLPTKRAFLQAMGRVGRCNESYLRFVWDGLVNEVDLELESHIRARLHQATPQRGHEQPAV